MYRKLEGSPVSCRIGARREELDVRVEDDLRHPLVPRIVEGWIHPQEGRDVHEPEYRTVSPTHSCARRTTRAGILARTIEREVHDRMKTG